MAEDEVALSNQGGVGKAKGKGKIGAMKGNTLESAFAKAAALKAAAQASASPEAKPLKAKAGGASKLGATAKPKAVKASPVAKAVAAPKPKRKKLAYDSDFDEGSSEEDEKVDITLYDDDDVEESDRGEGGSDQSGSYGRKVIDIASDSDAMMDEDEDESFIMPPPKKR